MKKKNENGKASLLSLLAIGTILTLTLAMAQTVRRDIVVDGNGTLVAPENLWSTNAAGIAAALGLGSAATNSAEAFNRAIVFGSAPATNSAGIPGSLIKNGNYLYLCTGTNSWARIELLTW